MRTFRRLASMPLMLIALAACSLRPTAPTPTWEVEPTFMVTRSPTPTGSPSPSGEFTTTLDADWLSPTALVTAAAPVRTPTPRPGSAPSLTPSATAIPTPDLSLPTPSITSFSVTPLSGVKRGDTVTASWSVVGSSARLCVNNIDYYGGRCDVVPLEGSTPIEVFWDEGIVQIELTVYRDLAADASWANSDTVILDLGCKNTWVFDALRADRRCPIAAARTWNGAAQPFEHGWMIWSGDEYLILFDAPDTLEGGAARLVQEIYDPLTITRDTSASVIAPAGFYAPESGFGLIWRGDVSESPGFQETLGWALQPESAYQTPYQCWLLKAYTSVSGRIENCYLNHPALGVISVTRSGLSHYWIDVE